MESPAGSLVIKCIHEGEAGGPDGQTIDSIYL